MRWYVTADYAGHLTDDEIAALDDPAVVVVVQVDEAAQVRITISADVESGAAACARIEAVPGLASLVATGALAGPHRLLAETEDARARSANLIDERDVMRRLGVSEDELRVLTVRSDWPEPLFTLPGGESMYAAAAIDVWAARWRRGEGTDVGS
jgi:hypothetical protein